MADGETTNGPAFQFTNAWFEGTARGVWDQLIPMIKPSRILEVGSYEGASAVYLVTRLGPQQALELHCIDTWEGGVEHQGTDMSAVEMRFRHNMDLAIQAVPNDVALVTHKGYSDTGLAKLLTEGKKNYFDFIYIDGSHQAPDVLCDAVIAFKLLKVGGVMVFDDYLWAEHHPRDVLRCPKAAIDAFVNININKLSLINAPPIQLYVQKTSD